MTTAASESADLPPGYYLDPKGSGAWMTLPWPGDQSLPWDHPSRLALLQPSLGPSLIRWGETWLVHHLTGRPWRYTAGQKRFLILWYSLDENLRWHFRRAVKRGAKGTGKDPFAAAWGVTELCGPVRPVGWDGDRPVGVRQRLPLVQYGANSEAQAKDVLRIANAMVSLALRDEVGYDGGETVSKIEGGGRVELLTASEMSAEGDPATAVGLNEVHHMTDQNGGMKTAKVAQRNVGKSPKELQARLIEFTNAHRQGADSRGERSYKAWQIQVSGKTKSKKIDILYDSMEADPALDITDPDQLMTGIRQAYTDAHWRDEERLHDEASDPDTSVADLIRYYLNGLATAEDAWVDPGNFDALARAGVELADGDQIAALLDCSKSGDATALVGCRLSDGHCFTLDVWQKPHGHAAAWLAPVTEVDARSRDVLKRYAVMWFGIDPSPALDGTGQESYWMPMIDALHRDYKDEIPNWATPGKNGHAFLYDMRISAPGGLQRLREFTAMAEQTATDIDGDPDETEVARQARLANPALTHDGDPSLRAHVHNARRRPNAFGVSLGKASRDSTNLVDLAVCMVGARLGRRIALNSGNTTSKRTGKVW
jgi:hypothetical protein